MKQQQKNEQMANQSEAQQNNQKYMIDDFSVGINLIILKEYQQAQKYFEQFLQENQDHPIAMYLLNFTLKQQNLIDEGDIIFEKAKLIHQNIYNFLIEYSNIKLKQDPNNIIFTYMKSQGYFEKHQNYEALQLLEDMIKINQNYCFPHLLKGRILVELNLIEEAKEAYNQAILINPHQLMAFNNLGCILFDECNYSEALKYFQNALQFNASQIFLYLNLGISLLGLENIEEGMNAFNHAVSMNPKRKKTLVFIYNHLLSINKYEEAENFLAQYQHRNPEDISVLSFQRDTLKKYEYYEQALLVNQQLLGLSPECLDTIFEQGELLQLLGNHEEAIVEFQHYIDANQQNFDVFEKYVAESLQQLGKHDQVLELFQHFINKNAQDLIGYYHKAKYLLSLDQFDEAILIMNHCLKVNPFHSEYWYLQGLLYYEKAQKEGFNQNIFQPCLLSALQSAQNAIEIDEEHFDSQILSAKTLKELNQLMKGINVLFNLLRLSQEDLEEVHKQLSDIRTLLNDPRLALIHLRLPNSDDYLIYHLVKFELYNDL